MLRLCRSVTGITLLAALATGCGSDGGDRLVLRFVGFDNVGITQEDAVKEASADVDVIQDICTVDMQGNPTSFEPFTQTVINAVFVNEGSADIQLTNYTVDSGKQSGIGVRDRQVTANLPGGRCNGGDQEGQHCAVDNDCVVSGSIGTCTHSQRTVSALLLFDFEDKLHVDPSIFDQGTNITVTFRGVDDADHAFVVTTGYVVTFADYNNCGGGAGGS